MPFDQQNYILAPAITPSRELVRDLPTPVDPVLERLVEGRARVAKGWCTHTMCEGYGSDRRWGGVVEARVACQ